MFWWGEKKTYQNFSDLRLKRDGQIGRRGFTNDGAAPRKQGKFESPRNILVLKCRSFTLTRPLHKKKNCRSEAKVGRQTCLIFLQNGWTRGGERWLVQPLSRAKSGRGQARTRRAIGQDAHPFMKKEGPRQFSSRLSRSENVCFVWWKTYVRPSRRLKKK